MSRFKLFVDSFIIYGLGGVISKIIPFLMLPIITRLFPNSFYIGLNDLSLSLISFMSAMAICGMYDAMFRLFFDKDDLMYKKEVCSTAFLFVVSVCMIFAVAFFMARKEVASWYFGSERYINLVVLTIVSFLISTTNQIVSAPTRIQNKRKVFLATNTLSPLISYSISIPMIIKGYYIVAMPVASIVAALIIELSFCYINRQWFSVKYFRMECLRELLKIGVPLMPNFIVYWIYNSVDKLMISKMLGTEFTGLYGVASRIGHISNLIYTAFSGGWLYFAYSTMKDKDQVELKSKVFEYLAVLSFIATACLISVDMIGFKVLFGEEYLTGYLVAPYLFISPLLLMLFQTVANQFTIIKKTYLNTFTLFLGATVNIVLNYVLIQTIGMEGAAVATVVGYEVSLLLCIAILKRWSLINISIRLYMSMLVFLAYFLVWRIFFAQSVFMPIIGAIAVITVYAVMYIKDIKLLFARRYGGNS